jgi:hypothetical protein
MSMELHHLADHQREIAGIWLGEGERPANDVDNIDLLFQIAGDKYIEIVLRSAGFVSYGGYLFGDEVEVLDEIVAGHRVLVATFEGNSVRYEFNPDHPQGPQYEPAHSAQYALPTSNVRRLRRANRR